MDNVVHNMVAICISHTESEQHAIWFKITEDNNYGPQRNWYPQRKSLNAFIQRHNFKHETHVWNNGKPSGNQLDENPIIVECSSVWDFFTKIGYDYKTKKFSYNGQMRKIYDDHIKLSTANS